MARLEQTAERGLTREEIIQKFPPRIEMAYPRPERAREGVLPLEFVVSRNETGTIIFAMGAEGYYKSLENTGEGSELADSSAGIEAVAPKGRLISGYFRVSQGALDLVRQNTARLLEQGSKRVSSGREMPHAIGEGSASDEQQGTLTTLEFAHKMEELRGDPVSLREIARVQERAKSAHHLGSKVNEEASW